MWNVVAVRELGRRFLLLVAIAAAYYGAARLGLSLAFETKQVTAVWPAAGIALAALLLFGYRSWPAVWVGAFFTDFTASEHAWTAAGIAVGSTLEALGGAYLLLRLARIDLSLERVRDVLALVAAAALAPIVSASVGVANLAFGGQVSWASFGSACWVWWAGDALGTLVVVPLALAWVTAIRRRHGPHGWELMALAAAVVGIGYVSFAGYLDGTGEPYQLEYAVFPLLIWAALRFTQAETTAAVVVIASFAVWAAVEELGPFAAASQDRRVIQLGLFVAVASVTALLLGAMTAERRQAVHALRRSHRDLESRVQARTAELAAVNTSLTRVNDALTRRTFELAAKNEEVEEFVYAVSHDLRAPLANLHGFSAELGLTLGDLDRELAAADLSGAARDRVRPLLEDTIPSALHYVGASVAQFQHLIDALLQLSHSGRTEYAMEEVDVRRLVESSVAALHQSIEASGATVVVQESLPRASGDATAIEQVFSNLIGNAVKYLRPDRPGQIEIGGDENGGICRYWVRDNGAGIPATAQKRLFQTFQRFHPELAPGDGMGLAIVKRIVERHGGKVWADSQEGAGSTFYVELPAASG